MKEAALLASALLFSQITQALPLDQEQPVHLAADAAIIDETKGIAVYTGNVKLTQGSLVIMAHKVEVLFDANNRVASFLAHGKEQKQAHLRHQANSDGNEVRAWADNLNYNIPEERLILTSNARLEQRDNQIKSAEIIYSMAQETVQANANPNGRNRVQMIFSPND